MKTLENINIPGIAKSTLINGWNTYFLRCVDMEIKRLTRILGIVTNDAPQSHD